MNWMISANGKMYDHAGAFNKWGFIDWRQKANYSVGDIVYIYCTLPIQKVMYKCRVEIINIVSSQIVNDYEFWFDKSEYEKSIKGNYVRLKLIEQVDTENLSLNRLIENGLTAAPQGPIKVNSQLVSYIELYMNDITGDNYFPDSDLDDTSFEGGVTKVTVNRFERSSIARRKCIEFHGSKCKVCEFDFEEVYGQIGKGYIHIHHLVPLSEIGKDYTVNYKEDLIPVCPNCHAMLHRQCHGQRLSLEQLKNEIKTSIT